MKNKELIKLNSNKWKNMDVKTMREELKLIYQKYIGRIVINKETQIPIQFYQTGRKKTLLYLKDDKEQKATIIEKMPELLRRAELIEVRIPKEQRKHFVKKVFVFRIHCLIDKKDATYIAIIRKTSEGVFQYDLYEEEALKKDVS